MNEKELVNQQSPIIKAIQLAKFPIVISLFLTPVRFLLEYAGLPEYAIFLLGLLWLTIAFSIYWGIKLYDHKQAYLTLLLSLIIYSPISRLTVVAAWWVDKRWELGTHYGLYFDSWTESFLNQVFYGSLVQVIPGFIIGSLTLRLRAVIKSKDQ